MKQNASKPIKTIILSFKFETCVKWPTSKTLPYDVIEFETYVKSFTSKAFGGDYIDFCWFEIYVKRSTSKTGFSNRFWNCQFEIYVKSFTLLSPFRPVIWVLFFAIHAKQMPPNHSQGKNISIKIVWDLCKTGPLQTLAWLVHISFSVWDLFLTPLWTRWFEIYVKLSTSNRIWNIRSIRVWDLCRTSFSGYPVPLRAFELLNLVNSQPFSLIYRRRFLCLSSALLLACAFSQRLFAWPLLLRLDRLITTKLLGEIKPFLLYVKVFWTGFWALPSTVRLAFCVWGLCKTGCL